MGYNFLEYFRNLDFYAILDMFVLIGILVVLIAFFIYKRNIKVLLVFLAIVLFDVLISVLSGLKDYEILTISKYITHFSVVASLLLIAVVYQNDFKSLVQKLSNSRGLNFSETVNSDDELRDATTEILTACQNMAKQNVGAIILVDMAKDINDSILDTGTILGAKLSASLIESIFNTKAPLHDGAVIIRGNKIVAASCFLTLTQQNVNKEMGTRHRAAIGVTENTNVLSIVVSEETGIISVVKSGEIKRYMTMDKLKDELEEAFGISPNALEKKQALKDKKHYGRF